MGGCTWEIRQLERKAKGALVLQSVPLCAGEEHRLQQPATDLGFLNCKVGIMTALTLMCCCEV